jgi:hypothetical protein
LRVLSLSLVLLICAASATQAGVSAYPSSYHSRGTEYYENLRTTKIAWLKANAATVASDLTADRTALASLKGRAAVDAKTAIDRLTVQASQIGAELDVMRGARDRRQESLLKRNVQSWIGAARRSGNGAEAIRLLYDLEGTGL